MIAANELEALLAALSERLPVRNTAGSADGGFNIFSILGLETKEVAICRFLGEFLRPDGSHGMGHIPLMKFVREVLGETCSEEEARRAEIVLEEPIEGEGDRDRRVDIAIRFPRRIIPIEVKIWARDQKTQLSDYYHYYKKQGVIDKIYYLTPTGWEPSAQSRGELTVGEQIGLLSFDKEIRNWCEALCAGESSPAGQCLKQFAEVIEKMCAESKELEIILDSLGVNGAFDAGKALAAMKLIEHGDTVGLAIRRAYVEDRLDFDESRYALENAEPGEFDKHALLKIVSKESGRAVAWICVDTNLYLGAKKVKDREAMRSEGGRLWSEKSTETYSWQYILPKGYRGKAFPLKNPEGFPDGKIEIDEWLDAVVQEDAER